MMVTIKCPNPYLAAILALHLDNEGYPTVWFAQHKSAAVYTMAPRVAVKYACEAINLKVN